MALKHYNQNESDGIHQPFNWVWADATAFAAEAPTNGQDVNKVGLVVDSNDIYMLVDLTPTWIHIGSPLLDIEFTIEAENANEIVVTIQLVYKTEGASIPLTDRNMVIDTWLADSGGDIPTGADIPDYFDADSILSLFTYTDKIHHRHELRASNGDEEIFYIGYATGAITYYMSVALPDGRIVTSEAITFAA